MQHLVDISHISPAKNCAFKNHHEKDNICEYILTNPSKKIFLQLSTTLKTNKQASQTSIRIPLPRHPIHSVGDHVAVSVRLETRPKFACNLMLSACAVPTAMGMLCLEHWSLYSNHDVCVSLWVCRVIIPRFRWNQNEVTVHFLLV